jgi:hypothetical protein
MATSEQSYGFGWALEMVKEGRRVARRGWNGPHQYIYLVPGHAAPTVGAGHPRHVEAAIAIRTTSGKTQIGWLASQGDMLASDWYEVGNGA